MSDIFGVIGGTGLYSPEIFRDFQSETVKSPYGEVPVRQGMCGPCKVVFLGRHGETHSVPPHNINYRANIAALKSLGVSKIIAINAVGGIAEETGPGKVIIPNQLIDYSWGRAHTFYDDFDEAMMHIDFTEPYCADLRQLLMASLKDMKQAFVNEGCYACTQGPRLETAAEITKYRQDGCTVVGMTGMPESALAKELGMAYVSLCYSVNWAAGIQPAISLDEIKQCVAASTTAIQKILMHFFSRDL